MGCGVSEATGLGFVCFVVLNPRMLSANRVDLGFFLFHNFSTFTVSDYSVRDKNLYASILHQNVLV